MTGRTAERTDGRTADLPDPDDPTGPENRTGPEDPTGDRTDEPADPADPAKSRPGRGRTKGGAVWRRLRMPAALLILGVVVHRLGTSTLLGALGRIDAQAVLLTFAFSVPATVLSAWRWCVVSRKLGIPLRLRTAVADYYQALFLNATLPSGVLGDVHRAVRNGRDAGDVGRGVRAVVLERTAGQAVIVAAGVVVLVVATPPLPVLGALEVPLATAGLVLLAVAAVAVAVLAGRGGRAAKWRRDLGVFLVDARAGLFARDTWPPVLVFSVLALCGHLGLFVTSARVAGSSAPVSALVAPLLMALLVMALPVNIGGWGPREGMCALAFGAAGLGATQGLASAVVYGALALLSSLPGAAVLAYRLPAARRSRGRGAAREVPEVEFEEHVRAEAEGTGPGPQGLPHPYGPWEAEPGYAVSEEDRRDRDVQPVQHFRAEEPGHRRAAALHKYPAKAAAGEGLQY
nr:lysylphosphatidylglycerol synthase transmembrane domain-containing protein [Streptomyces sp. HNM0575]